MTCASAPSSAESACSTTACTSQASSTPGCASPTPSAERSSPSASPESPSSTTSEVLGQLPLHPSMSSSAASPARASQALARNRDSVTPKPFCGERCSGPLASFDPATSSWRTSQSSLSFDPQEDTQETSGERFLEAFPRSGCVSSGIAYQQQPSAPLTDVTGSLPLLPTPMAEMKGPASKRGANAQGGPSLREALRLLPTPAEADSRNTRNATANDGEGSTGHPGSTLSDVAHRWKEAVKLLPTPHGMPKQGQKRRPGPSGNELGHALGSLSSGEITSPPSDDGSKSTALRLSPWFVEWMLGAPQGWSDPDCQLSATAFSARSDSSPASTSSISSKALLTCP